MTTESIQTNKYIGYKLFKVKVSRQGEIFPLYVNADKPTPMGVWVDAEYGERKDNGKVKSKLGDLAFRPGWHLSDYPYVRHIGQKGKSGNIEFTYPDVIWCEVEYSHKVDYQLVANQNGINKKGILIPKNAYIKDVPYNGYYRYKTNPNMYQDWIIAGSIKINKILTDTEVYNICTKYGLIPLPRKEEFNAVKYGF